MNALIETETKCCGAQLREIKRIWFSSQQCTLTPVFVLLLLLKNLQGELGKTLQPYFEN